MDDWSVVWPRITSTALVADWEQDQVSEPYCMYTDIVRMKMNNRLFNIQLFLLPLPYKFSFNAYHICPSGGEFLPALIPVYQYAI